MERSVMHKKSVAEQITNDYAFIPSWALFEPDVNWMKFARKLVGSTAEEISEALTAAYEKGAHQGYRNAPNED